jgi:hypothetical protein
MLLIETLQIDVKMIGLPYIPARCKFKERKVSFEDLPHKTID